MEATKQLQCVITQVPQIAIDIIHKHFLNVGSDRVICLLHF
jgi:hypothetical protein